jgi:hypothetical protein
MRRHLCRVRDTTACIGGVKRRRARARSPNRAQKPARGIGPAACRTLRVACCCDRLLSAGFAAQDRSARPTFLRTGAASRGAMTAPRQA